MSELEDRRQRAREAYYDNGGAPDARGEYAPIEMAIETATRVQITPELEAAYVQGSTDRRSTRLDALAAAFRAAGFEVVA